jgi:hypothetical protein
LIIKEWCARSVWTKATCDHFAAGAGAPSLLFSARPQSFLMKLLGRESKSPLWHYYSCLFVCLFMREYQLTATKSASMHSIYVGWCVPVRVL